MAIQFRKSAIKFLEKADSEVAANIRETLTQLMVFFDEYGVLPFTEFDIKKLKGEWEG
ncbi:type II toxin-antitoxin system RelE/ParE family toxin, partial [Pseudanabaenaceae cyanobacterium LEGE 13415]|nr:type II toxin-antitoxin system RelE/ParE family toxin [Pseudanabaenaceae cyanobacterium LEGE 13415]